MKLNVGDYVRTKKGIAKIIGRINDPTNYFDKFWVCDKYLELNDDTEYVHEQDIIKSSPNIIDLIEVGDILTIKDIFGNLSKVEVDENFKLLTGRIISIVTKEQFEQMEYKIN